MKILQLLEDMAQHIPDAPDFKLKSVNAFSEENGLIDGSFDVVNKNNGVEYTVDLLLNPKTRGYKINAVHVSDGPQHYDGDVDDLKLMIRFFKDNVQEIGSQLQQDVDELNRMG